MWTAPTNLAARSLISIGEVENLPLTMQSVSYLVDLADGKEGGGTLLTNAKSDTARLSITPVSWSHCCAALLATQGARTSLVPAVIEPAGLMQRLSSSITLPRPVGSDQVCRAEPGLHGSITTVALAALADAATHSAGFFLGEMANLGDFSYIVLQ
jgi:hypothetical protein